jgi:hypothetical protein
VSPAGNLRTKL